MSRVSDTRIRTREAAARLVAAGRLPHELTVDLIYAEIRQGSRTTINDELKQWKDEKTRVDALSRQLPPAVADAMLAAWAVAVEHGEKVYDSRVGELEAELADALVRATTAARTCASAEEARRVADALSAGQGVRVADLQRQLAAAADDQKAAQARIAALEQLLDTTRQQADVKLDALRATHDREVAALRASVDTGDAAFQSELSRATERMEGVQKHMMKQISEARDERTRAEAQSAKIREKCETLHAETGALRTDLTEKKRMLERSGKSLEQAEADLQRLRNEHLAALAQLAEAHGKLESVGQLVASLEARARAAEARPSDEISGHRGTAAPGHGKS
ncbi:DNA-binding protein [Paraburkholderia fungorum]|uniref:DNA-binding protein n=1 Tax=Paraburkholderia fungorum TaxID=134537 RepID=UPI003313D5A8